MEHNLTHIPYRTWCKYCIMSRRPNDPHRSKATKRTVPLLVGDYCFLRNSSDEILQTVLVVRVYPFRMLLAIPVSAKGATDEYAVSRLVDFIKNVGVNQFVHISDQEASLRATFEAAIQRLVVDAQITQAVPEKSAVGESQSNGLAEKSRAAP